MDNWKVVFEVVLAQKLSEAAKEFSLKKLRIIDIGIFPWHTSIELSLLFSDDTCDVNDIADWPHYDYSQFNEGGWPQAVPVAKEINKAWKIGWWV